MKSSVKNAFVPLVLSGAMLVIALNTWFAFQSVQLLINSDFWVKHTWEVIVQVESILGSMKDAETGARGYIITGKDPYLEPYREALGELPGELDHFGLLTADNKSQGVRLVGMRGLIGLRLDLLKERIERKQAGLPDAPQALVGTGKQRMDEVREVAAEMIKEEKRLLEMRARDARRASQQTRFSIVLASGLDLLLIVLMFRYFVRERELRLVTEQTAERLAVERVKAESAAEEVLALNRTLEDRVKQRTVELETTNRELEAFSYSVSHDLRAPLRTIDGFSLALEEDYAGAVDAVGRDYIRRVRSGVQRMGQLIDSLLQLSRITRAELSRSEVDLSAMAKTIVENLHDENPEREVDFAIEPGMLATADPKLVQVALENLLGNAVKFTAKVERARVEFGWDGKEAAWFVRDNGAGFDMFYKDKLFNAFNRLHGDKDFKGSGIGLATVARVVRRHHGRIWADAIVDRGATFWFTLG